MASSVNSLFGSSASGASSATAASSSATGLSGAVPSEGVFLQLLVSQLKNQDPLNPTDSTTFVTQLAQFSELEQVMAIRGDTDQLATAASQSGSSASPGSSSTAGSQPVTTTTNSSGTNSTTSTTNQSTTN